MVVGYEKTEILTSQQKIIAGVISGITTRFITQPLDIVKIRTQLQSKQKYKTWVGLSWRILKEEGLYTFWHGHSIGQIHSILSVASQFHAYEMSTRLVEDNASPQYKKVLLFMCGIFAGCTSATLVSPLDVIRVRQMIVKAQYDGLLAGARNVYRSGGILAFYEGLPATLMQMGPQVGITFAVFRYVQPLLLQYLTTCEGAECEGDKAQKVNKKNLLISSTVAGSLAGFFSKSMTYPFDLAKRRLQIGSHKVNPNVKTPSTSRDLVKCHTLISCLMDMIRKVGYVDNSSVDGVPGLFSGWAVTVYKSQIYTMVSFTAYEMMCFELREHNLGKQHAGGKPTLCVKIQSPDDRNRMDCGQYGKITPEIIVDSLRELSFWRDPIEFTIILNHIKEHFPVNPNLTELEIELSRKLLVAEKSGIVKGDKSNRWRLVSSLERLRQFPETQISLFWQIHNDTINPLSDKIKREPPIQIEIQHKEDSDSEPPSDG